MNIGLLGNYITCSCYKTQIFYSMGNYDKIYACHCSKCIKDNLNNKVPFSDKNPIIWVNVKNFIITNEFNNNTTSVDEDNTNVKIKWKHSGLMMKRGYCPVCNDPLLIDYYFSKYIANNTATPVADLYCKNKNNQLSIKSYRSLFELFFHNLFFK